MDAGYDPLGRHLQLMAVGKLKKRNWGKAMNSDDTERRPVDLCTMVTSLCLCFLMTKMKTKL
jgi:hypothetical protein